MIFVTKTYSIINHWQTFVLRDILLVSSAPNQIRSTACKMKELPETTGTPIPGGYGIVKIVKYNDGRVVARKELMNNHDPEHVARFVHEIKIVKALDHRNIINILDSNLEIPPYWFEMPVLTTWQEYTRLNKWNYQGIKSVFSMILQGIKHAHDSEVIHRDIKPGNILFDDDGIPIISDFGLGLHSDPDFTRHTGVGVGLGTLGFAAPEQFEQGNARNVDKRADIHGLGMLLLYMFTGSIKFNTLQHVRNNLVRLFISKCTKADRSERYANIDDMINAFIEIDFIDELDMLRNVIETLNDDRDVSDETITQLRKTTQSANYVCEFLLNCDLKSLTRLKERDSALFNQLLINFIQNISDYRVSGTMLDTVMEKCLEFSKLFSADSMLYADFLFGVTKFFHSSSSTWHGVHPGLKFLKCMLKNACESDPNDFKCHRFVIKLKNYGDLRLIEFVKSTARDDCGNLVTAIDVALK